MRSTRAIATAVLLLAAGCRGGKGGLSDSTFVATMADLRRVQENATYDSAERAQARAAVFRRRGVTAEQLERTAAAMASDPTRASAVWQAIDRHVQEGEEPAKPQKKANQQ